MKNKKLYKLQNFNGINLVMYMKNKEHKEDKIFVPDEMLKSLLK